MTPLLSHTDTWRSARRPLLTSVQNAWLRRPGALTAGLRRVGRVELRVLREYVQGLPRDEASALRLAPRAPVWVREVAMAIDGEDCVIARSITPLAASHGVWQGMRRLRTRPLADMLYHQPSIRRSAFFCCSPTRRVPMHRTVALSGADMGALSAAGTLWARRSTFWRLGQPLMVAECFLPAFWDKLRPPDRRPISR
jgi:chorismate--pyruvate lyase